jgi:hypothetical protein
MGRLIIAGLCIALGFLTGYRAAEFRHDKAMAKAADRLEAAQAEKNEQLAILSKAYYEQFEAISNREPAVVERRVYVKTDCVPARTGTGLGDAADAGGAGADGAATGSTGKVALAPDTVQAVASVADRAERLYQQCVTRLQYFQDRHER